jgi:serine/threonine-protein kinase HipA
MRSAEIHMHGRLAGRLVENEDGYEFQYNPAYLALDDAEYISSTLPLQEQAFTGSTLFPFFDGLIPEGWLLDVAEETWKLDPRDRMGLLLACCLDCIGAVSVHPSGEAP